MASQPGGHGDAAWRRGGRVVGQALAVLGLGGLLGAVHAGLRDRPLEVVLPEPVSLGGSPRPPAAESVAPEAAPTNGGGTGSDVGTGADTVGDSDLVESAGTSTAAGAADAVNAPEAAVGAAQDDVTDGDAAASVAVATGGVGDAAARDEALAQIFAPRTNVAMLDLEWSLLAHESGAVFVDARSASEFEKGRIPGALNLPPDRSADPGSSAFRRLIGHVNERDLESWPVVVYCAGGDCTDSKLVASRLLEAGFGNVLVMQPGINGWLDAGHAIEGS